MTLSPVLTGLRTYPFVRLTDAKRRLAAQGVPIVDFGAGEPREDTPAFIREALVQAIEPQSRYPLADGLAELTGGLGELTITSNSGSGAVAVEHPLARKLVQAGNLAVAPKQAWTPVAEFAAAGFPAVNFGPGAPAQAHRRDESVEIAALERAFRVLEAFAA